MSCGEIISAVVFCRVLREKGYPCVALTGASGIITDSSYTNARILKIVPDRLNKNWLTGRSWWSLVFREPTAEEITTLGRGGSDDGYRSGRRPEGRIGRNLHRCGRRDDC